MSDVKRILIVTPTYFPSLTGNAVTVHRLRQSLAELGAKAEVIDVSRASGPGVVAGAVRSTAPDVIHAYHARKGAALVLAAAEREPAAARTPLVLTLPGTDVSVDLDDPSRREDVLRAGARASRLIASSGEVRERVARDLPEWLSRLVFIPKAAVLPQGGPPYELRRPLGIPPDACVFFLPGGVRPIKGNAFSLEPLARLHEQDARVRLVLAGPVLDAAYGRELLRRVSRLRFAAHIPDIPYECMAGAYADCDVVLNTSETEGLANALLEAQAAGRAALASDIPGNRSAVPDGEVGLLYRAGDAEDFLAKARLLAQDAALRTRLGEAGRARAARDLDPRAEALAHLAVYREAVGARA